MKIILTLILIFLTFITARSQIKRFYWHDFMCIYEGEYDSTKVTEQELKDTYSICRPMAFVLEGIWVWKPEDLDRLNLNEFRSNYKVKLKKLKRLNLIKSPKWEEIRQYKIDRLKEEYRILNITIKSFKNPSILKKEFPDAAPCFKFIDAIILGNDDLLSAWENLVRENCKNNSDSESCFTERYLTKLSSPQKLIWAQIELMNFGWRNCMGKFVQKYQRKDYELEFSNEFINLVHHCGE